MLLPLALHESVPYCERDESFSAPVSRDVCLQHPRPVAAGRRHRDVNVGGLGDVAAFQNFDIECLFEPEVV